MTWIAFIGIFCYLIGLLGGAFLIGEALREMSRPARKFRVFITGLGAVIWPLLVIIIMAIFAAIIIADTLSGRENPEEVEEIKNPEVKGEE